MQFKGNIHISFNEPVTSQEIAAAAELDKNERFKALGVSMDRKIVANYKLWPNNYIACDMLDSSNKYSANYTPEQKAAFEAHIDKQLSASGSEDSEMREILLSIYANPVKSLNNL